jgi:hypothetical protein
MQSKSLLAIKRERFLLFFFFSHVAFAMFLGRLFAFAPDEGGYLYTFNNLYNPSLDENPQLKSGWITAPKSFLWISYLPAKLLNLLGVPDYLSIRILSVILGTLTLYLLKNVVTNSSYMKNISQKIIYVFFFIPSVFLWTTVGLRESFIFMQIALFLSGVNLLVMNKNRVGITLLFLGSYGLVSTKNYLWLCLMIALVLSIIVFTIRGGNSSITFKVLMAGILAPLVFFLSTTSIYALSFILKTDISTIGERTSYSSTTFDKNSELGGSNTSETGDIDGGPIELPSEEENFTVYGDTTLISLYSYLIANPNSANTLALKAFGLEEKIKELRNESILVAQNQSKLSVHGASPTQEDQILSPAKISQPLTFIPAVTVFLFGPVPFNGEQTLGVRLASFESPLWWLLYGLVIFQFVRFRSKKIFSDLPLLIATLFLLGEVLMSAIIEVNIGTSFRHRSIILIPLIFIFVRLPQLQSINRIERNNRLE